MSENLESDNNVTEADGGGSELSEGMSRGPRARERAFLEQRVSVLRSDGTAPITRGELPPDGQPRSLEEGLASLPADFRQHLMTAYRRRQQPNLPRPPDIVIRDAPLAPPANNWVPIGPSVVRQGQAVGRPAVSGRAVGIAVAAGEERVYVASANGGVWRSDDGGASWRSTMDAWDLNPTTFASDSLACGAIVIDPDKPDRVFVGTGEGASGAYFGVGAIRSDDGGKNWMTEPTAPGSAPLAGSAFYALVIDPTDGERVIGATRRGLYRREPDGQGSYHWVQKADGSFTSVVVSRSAGATLFMAAKQEGGIFRSPDGEAWTPVNEGFPTVNVGRIGLAVQPDNPEVVYALVSRRDNDHLHGVYRLDVLDGVWREVRGAPADLFGPAGIGQGWYDLAIAVDPHDVNRIYLGGSTKNANDHWCGSLYRCTVGAEGSGPDLRYTMSHQYIGATTHADIHSLVFTPGESDKLWVGCDGGVFYTDDATGRANFEARNVGLATLTMNHLAHHPTEEAVLFCGTQDNGTTRYTGEKVWLHSAPGDGGYVVINWHNPYKILRTYVQGYIYRATDGGQSYDSWEWAGLPGVHRNQALFYAPLAGPPPNPKAPGEADLVAFGGRRPWISTDFGDTWQSIPRDDSSDELPAEILSLAFASATRLYAGTMQGQVYRFDRVGDTWTRTQINTVGDEDALPLSGPVTDIAVDPVDPDGGAIYITLGGVGDFRRVWHFNGGRWQARSGPSVDSPDGLLDVQHNAIVVDPEHPSHLYVGADIGVWCSTDGGATWRTFSYGLPDAAVLDLELHPVRRLLRAATHGRGVYEYMLDSESARGVELYVRSTQLDVGRRPTVIDLADPTRPGRKIRHWEAPDIKVDIPSAMGTYQTPTNHINFYQFAEAITGGSGGLASAALGNGRVTNRVYVQVHNRGVVPASEVRVMLLMANASAGLPCLPIGYESYVRTGTPINTQHWQTVGIQTLHDLEVGFPQIVAFDLPSTLLPPPVSDSRNAHYALLALTHCPGDDEFRANQVHVDTLSVIERKVAQKSVHVVQFAGDITAGPSQWMALRLHGVPYSELISDLVFELSGYPGRVRLVVPKALEFADGPKESFVGFHEGESFGLVEWVEQQLDELRDYARRKSFNPLWVEQMIEAIERVRGQPVFAATPRKERAILRRFFVPPKGHYTVFLSVDPPAGARVGDTFSFTVYQRYADKDAILGGSTYEVQIVPEPDDEAELSVEVWGKRMWFLGLEVLNVRVRADDGSILGPEDGARVSIYMHTSQGIEKSMRSMSYHSLWHSFWLRVDRLPHLSPGVIKVTVVARLKGKEARKTQVIRL